MASLKRTEKLIMIMADGLGLPPEGIEDSVYARYCPAKFTELLENYSVPLDACLDVEGLPQSATGQTSLFTGVNASKHCGMHMQAFPGPSLREIIRRGNIFSALAGRGYKAAFANAYIRNGPEELAVMRLASVTTVMSASLPQGVFRLPDLRMNKAVYHDITRKSLDYVEDLPLRTAAEAAGDLIRLSSEYDFVLFEYFMTDRAGHKKNREYLAGILHDFGDFVSELAVSLPENYALLLTSDHGNCEDIVCGSHTSNPVPLMVYPDTGHDKSAVKSISGVMDFILAHFPPKTV